MSQKDMEPLGVIASFLARFHDDRERGAIQPLEAYQALFPTHRAAIAKEYRYLTGGEGEEIVLEPDIPPGEIPEHLQRFGAYTLLRELGRGGQGVVYLADDSRKRRQVALKVLSAASALSLPLRARLLREAEAAARLDHPGICDVYEAGEEGGLPFIAMQYIEGMTLGRKLATQKSPEGSSSVDRAGILAAVRLIERAARALHTAHEAGIVHRDMKPGNIMITPEGEPVLLDFGLARDETSNAPSLTHTGQVLGTPAYMAPEQISALRVPVDRRADIYALGVTLYECLTLRRPFEAPTREQLYRQILATNPPDPRRLNGGVPPDLKAVLEVALEKDRDRRYQTAADLADDLERIQIEEPIRARPPGAVRRARQWAVHHPGWAVTLGVGLCLLVVLALATILIWQEKSRTEDALQLAEKREKETQQVSDFQALMLSGIKVEAMGRRIKERFREQVQAALERQYVGEFPDRRKRTPEEIEAELAAFDQRANAAQAVDVARRVMDEFVLARAAAELEKKFTEQPLVRARLHNALGIAYRDLGLYGAAEKHFRVALQIRQRKLGDDHADTLTSMSRLGYVLFVQCKPAKLAEAEEYYRKALEGRRRVLGDLHPATLGSINDMGELLVDRRPDEAEPYYREALKGRRRVLGDKHRDTLTSIHNIGYLLWVQGKLEKAEPYFREVLKENPESLTAMHNMGLLLHAQGRPAEAERCFREVLEKSHPVVGDDHPDLLPTIHALASTLRAQGKLAEAKPYLRRALEGCRRLLGDDHGLTRRLINDMGVLLVAQRKHAEAERYLREALETSRRLGVEYGDTLGIIHNLGFALERQGKREEAMAHYREVLEKSRRHLGDEHPDTLNYFNSMGKALQAKGELDEARSLFEVATRAARSGPGDHLMTALIEHHYADVLCKLGSVDKALEFAQSAVNRYRAHPEWPPGEARHGRQVLAEVLRAAGRQAEALAVRWESVQALRQRPGVTQGRLASALARFALEAIATADRASLEQAEQAARQSLEIRRTVLPEDHRLVWLRYDTMSLLGEALVGQAGDASLAVEARMEKFREAEDLLVESGRWLTRNGGRIPQHIRAERLRQALERVVKLYESWHAAEPDTGKAERAAEWRTKLEKLSRP